VERQEQYAAQNALQPRVRGDRRAHSDTGQRKPEDGLRVSPSAPRVRHLSDQPPILPVQTPPPTGLADKFGELDVESDVISSEETSSDNGCEDVYVECLQLTQMLHQASEQVAEIQRKRMGKNSDSITLLQRRIEEQAFQLEMWMQEADLKTLEKNSSDADLVAFVGRVLIRLRKRVKRVVDCDDFQFRQYRTTFDKPTQMNIEQDMKDISDSEDSSLPPEQLLDANSLNKDLQGIELQVRTLHRLRRTVSQAQQSRFEKTVQAHVEEVAWYFGTDEALNVYSDGAVLPGEAALKMAREIDVKV